MKEKLDRKQVEKLFDRKQIKNIKVYDSILGIIAKDENGSYPNITLRDMFEIASNKLGDDENELLIRSYYGIWDVRFSTKEKTFISLKEELIDALFEVCVELKKNELC